MVKIYLVRHGAAKQISKGGDAARTLSDVGHDEVGRMASFLGRSIRVPQVLHSGLLRAAQTALILSQTLSPGRMAEESSTSMSPMADVEPFAESLARTTEDVMVVGHMPFLGRLVAYIITGDADADVCDFETAAVACLQDTDNGWVLQWLVSPRLLGMKGIDKGDMN